MANYNMNQWMKEADEEAKKYQEQVKLNNQQALDTLTTAKNNALLQLENQNTNNLYNLNTNQSTINANAERDAKQLYVNKLLALKQNEQAMNRAGLGTQGIVGSQVNSINNNYGTNLSNVMTQKANDLNDLAKQKQNAIDTYTQNKLNLTNQYDTAYSDTLTSINDKALSQYNTIYNAYLQMKQNEYQAQVQQEEAERQYALQMAAMSGGYGEDDFGFGSTPTITTDYYNGKMPTSTYEDLQKGAFNTVDKNGTRYQPNNINGNPLKAYGMAGYYLGSNATNSSGVNIANQNIWQDKVTGKFYIWNGSKLVYEQVQIPNASSFMKSK